MIISDSPFTLDGNLYKAEHVEKFGVNHERVIVWTKDDDLLGDIEINDNTEQIAVVYNSPDEGENPSASYDYFDYHGNGDEKVTEIAKWLIATHPNMA